MYYWNQAVVQTFSNFWSQNLRQWEHNKYQLEVLEEANEPKESNKVKQVKNHYTMGRSNVH